MNEDARCANCRFFESHRREGFHNDAQRGNCRRNSPLPVVLPNTAPFIDSYTNWPIVTASDFCGDWSARR